MPNRIAITGASSDIGVAICQRIIHDGDSVLLHCFKNGERLEQWARNKPISCEVVSADFNSITEVENFGQKLADLDILINLAAVTRVGLLPMLSDEDVAQTLNVNIRALVTICRKAIPSMLARRSGCIVNISSVVANRAERGQTVYAGSKGFMEAFSRALAAEYGSRGIRVNCVAPGPIDCGSLRELLAYAGEEVKKSNTRGAPGEPEDVAAAVAFLCSKDAHYINGRVLAVDGGFCAGV